MILISLSFLLLGAVAIAASTAGPHNSPVGGKPSSLLLPTINRLRPGIDAKIVGTVSSDEPLKSPVGHRRCVYYEYELQRYVTVYDPRGRPSERWDTVFADQLAVPFQLRDRTGELTVEPTGAIFKPRTVGVFRVPPEGVTDEGLRAALEPESPDVQTRIIERIIPLNSMVAVVGSVGQMDGALTLHEGAGPFSIAYQPDEGDAATLMSHLLRDIGFIAMAIGLAIGLYWLFTELL